MTKELAPNVTVNGHRMQLAEFLRMRYTLVKL